MNNKILHRIYFFLIMLLFISFQSTLQSQTRMNKRNNEQYKNYNNEIINKLQKKYNLTNEMINLPNINVTEVVDSVVGLDLFGNKFKNMYQYDNRGNIIAEITQDWDGAKLVNDGRTIYEFNSAGKQTSQIRERWDGTTWVNNNKFTEIYDANGNSVEELDQDWDGTQWVNSSRWISTYNSEGEKISEQSEEWDGSAWVPDYRETPSTGTDGSTVYISQVWDGSVWVNDARNTLKYNGSNKFESILEELWDGTVWVNHELTTFTYDESGRNISVSGEYWENEAWINAYRYSYLFDSNGLRTAWSFEYWNETKWENDFRFVYTYDANGSKTIELIEEWDGSSFIGTSRTTFTNNANGNVIFAIHESWDESTWVESPTYLGFNVDVDSENSNYFSFLSTRINVYYASITDVNLIENLPAHFELSQNYPNPFNPSTTIQYTVPAIANENYHSLQLTIYDVLGKEVQTLVNQKQKSGTYEVSFNASSFSSGIYFYTLKVGKHIQTKRMMLLK